jgi:hypothetical protein
MKFAHRTRPGIGEAGSSAAPNARHFPEHEPFDD